MKIHEIIYFNNKISESVETPKSILRNKKSIVNNLMSNMDERSIAAIFEIDYNTDTHTLANLWFDSCMQIYNRIIKDGHAIIYRQMRVIDFEDFIESLNDTSAFLGKHWSIHHSIESPTWKENHRGAVPILIVAKIATSQINWISTLHQNFEYPHEGEIIFGGKVAVETVENQEEDIEVTVNRSFFP